MDWDIVDPTDPNNPEHTHLYESDCVPIDGIDSDTTNVEWRRLPNDHRLKIHHREYHKDDALSTAGQPAEEDE